MRCGATKPEGLPQVAALSQASGGPSANGDRSKAARNKRLKWVHEYRIDHVTKIREHAAMFCVPCARNKPAKRQSAAGAAGAAAVTPVLEATSAQTDDSPMPSPGLTTNGGRALSPTAALSPKAAVPVASLPPVLEATTVTTNIAGTIGRRQAGNAVNITTMQCSSSSSSNFSGNGVTEDAANVTATGTATAAAGAPAATPIGIAPPPVVA